MGKLICLKKLSSFYKAQPFTEDSYYNLIIVFRKIFYSFNLIFSFDEKSDWRELNPFESLSSNLTNDERSTF